jgi:hypothetical protein
MGSTVRGISMGRMCSIKPPTTTAESVIVSPGSTNATDVTAGLSGSWQQDIEQFVMSLMSCPQSPIVAEFEGAFW